MVRYAGQILTSITVSQHSLCSPIMADVIPRQTGGMRSGAGWEAAASRREENLNRELLD